MKIKKLVKKAEEFLDSDKRKRKEKIACLKHVLKKLRKREHKLKDKLAEEKGEKARHKYHKEAELAHAQRQKGLKLLKELKRA